MTVYELIKELEEYPHNWDVIIPGQGSNDGNPDFVSEVGHRKVTEFMPQYKEGVEGPTLGCYFDGPSCYAGEEHSTSKLGPSEYPIRFVLQIK